MSAMGKKNKESDTKNIGSKLVIDSVKKIHKDLLDSFEKKEKVVLGSESIETIDLAGIQLLLWAEQYAQKKGIELSLKINYSNSARDLIEKAGFSGILK